jgi:hypothetical protein
MECDVLCRVFHQGRSLLKPPYSMALEADSKLFEEVLEPLKKATPLSKSHDMEMSGNSFEDDEDTPTMDQPFIDLCE